MRILIAIDLNDDDLTDAYNFEQTPPSANPWGHEWDDLLASIDARLDEAGYMGRENVPVRGRLVAAAPIDHGLPHLLDCAEVGVEGSDHPDAGLVRGIIATLREHEAATYTSGMVTP